MTSFITTVEEVTPAWLTVTLRQNGALQEGEVIAIQRRGNPAFNSVIAHLELTYSSDKVGAAPTRLLVKLNKDSNGEEEIAFYNLIAPLTSHLPMLVPCYAAAYSPESGHSYLLLQDISETHREPVTRQQILSGQGVPSAVHLDGTVDALAHFHAYWWEHPWLGKEETTAVRPWYRDRDFYEQHTQRRVREWFLFKDAVGGWFPSELQTLYEDVLAHFPHLWRRYVEQRVTTFKNITLSNGDCYFAQFLCPREPTDGRTYIVDFDSASANLGTYDLVYMFATFWTPEQRHAQQREERLLRRYYQSLQTHGVKDYSWDELLTDYKLMITYMIFDPVWNQTSGSSREYWWPKLQCLTGAYRDLGCADLLR